MVLVRSSEGWQEVTVPESSWSFPLQNLYGMLFLRLKEKGLTEQKAAVAAEAIVYKKLYPGLHYDKDLEKVLEGVFSA